MRLQQLVIFLLFLTCISCTVRKGPGSGSPEGYDAATKDVEFLKVTLKSKTPEQLIEAFIPTGPHRYGGYEYYYKYMANRAIQKELASRGAEAEPALRANTENKTEIWDAINGRKDFTVGRICTDLLNRSTK